MEAGIPITGTLNSDEKMLAPVNDPLPPLTLRHRCCFFEGDQRQWLCIFESKKSIDLAEREGHNPFQVCLLTDRMSGSMKLSINPLETLMNTYLPQWLNFC